MGESNQLISIFFLLALFGSHGQMAPAAGAGAGSDVTYAPGGSWEYNLLTTVFLNEFGTSGKDVGFQVSAKVKVGSVWKNPAQTSERLLKFELVSPRLHIKSRKAPAPEGFVEHSSQLEQFANAPFLVHWLQGRVQSTYIPMKEPLSIVNLKKGIASLFQFQLLDLQTNETDSSGHCSVSYVSTGPTTFKKIKKSCIASEDTPYLLHPDQLFSVNTNSKRESQYKMADNNAYVESLTVDESHDMIVTARPDAGNKVKITQELIIEQSSAINPIVSEKIDDVIEQITNEVGNHFTQETLMTERETKMCQDSECPPFSQLISENVKNINAKHFGTVKAATGFLKTLSAAREADKEEIFKVLKKKSNKPVLAGIYDILGAAQTMSAHKAAMKILHLNEEEHSDLIERYLWALSIGSHPKQQVITDLLNRYLKMSDLSEKVQETLILTIAAMTDKYIRKPSNIGKKLIYEKVKEAIYNGIENCEKKPCQYAFIRALKNLRNEDTIPKLIDIAIRGSEKSSVIAMKALRSFDPSIWNKDVIKTAKNIFFQIPKKYDSSSRTLALDILTMSKPCEKTIKELLFYLISNDKAFEVKKYVMQKLLMFAEKSPEFRQKLRNVIKTDTRLNNYSVLAQKGMSTALSRQFLNHSVTNGSMISAQEMNSGLVKRGVFDIVLENDDRSCEMFSLGLFSGGLSSFISSDDTDEPSDDDVATAGLELTLLGTQIRPFVFFTGQGELMGHVWSGTGSESTTAFQINTLLHDHLEYLRLGPGLIAELNLQTGVSFNLAGEIQISLWNRNSHSLVNQNAAVVMIGLLRVDTSFVQSKVEFVVSTEPKLDLESDVEFGSGVAVCLRLQQPNTIFKHNIFKVERIPGSKHKLRKAKYKKIEIPGKTYNLNQKNNEMCNQLKQ